MSEIGYIIRYRPYIWEVNGVGHMDIVHFNPIDEFFTDKIEFETRVAELEKDYFVDLDGAVYDGVDINEMYWCELHKIE